MRLILRESMLIYLKAGGQLRDLLRPDMDCYTKQIEVPEGLTIREIVNTLGIKPQLIAFVSTNGNIKRLDYIPGDGEEITLHPPVSGG
jgi:sulfur carrier protein ThiS